MTAAASAVKGASRGNNTRLYARGTDSTTPSGLLIDETEGVLSSSAYRSRFGGLTRAHRLAG